MQRCVLNLDRLFAGDVDPEVERAPWLVIGVDYGYVTYVSCSRYSGQDENISKSKETRYAKWQGGRCRV
jgi:hypothetical protein